MQIKRKNPSYTSSRNIARTGRQTAAPVDVSIESLTHDGRGVARYRGRVVFVEGAIPGDQVRVRVTRQTTKRTEGVIAKVLEPSPSRVEPLCPWYSQCGGCNQQHVDSKALLEMKQGIALGQLQRFADLQPDLIEPALHSPVWGYRSRARLAVRWWNGKVHFGFRASGSKDIVPVTECAVLMPELSQLLPKLRACLEQGRNRRAVSHIELAAAENGIGLLLRTVEKMPDEDRERWLALAAEPVAGGSELEENLHSAGVHLYIQPESSTQSLTCIHAPDGSDSLRYSLAEHDVSLNFLPVDFTQVNPFINRQMVSRALEWLALKPADTVLDLFCGMGNFTLPLARSCREVVGVEGVQELVDRAQQNARNNGLDNVRFVRADLAAEPGHRDWLKPEYDALLLDPPRTGALEILQQLNAEKSGNSLPERILYVSCNPATLARDAGFLKEQGYRLARFCVMDMFPQTTHVESMGLFVKRNQ